MIEITASGIKFSVHSELEAYRVKSIMEKEPETIEWIKSWNSKSKVFYDVGANIGVYGIFAAHLHKNLEVFCFEPEHSNYSSLLQNIILNGFENITPLNIALTDRKLLATLYLSDLRVGNSGAQVEKPVNELGHEFLPLKKERVLAFSMDEFVDEFNLPLPNFIKVDVDGQETKIINGMKNILSNENLESILIEFNNENEIEEFQPYLNSIGFIRDSRFDNLENHSSLRRVKSGSAARNYIFTRA